MAAPVIESFTTASSSSNVTTLAINKPTGVTSGDLLLILCANEENADNAQWNGTTPTGFTWLGSEYGSSVSDQTASGYYRIADGTEASTFTVTSANSWERTQWCFRISGVDQTTPINIEEGGLRNANTSYVIPTDGGTQLTTTVNDCLLLCLASYDGGDSTDMTVSGTGWSQHSSSPIITGTGGANMSTCVGTGTLATAGNAPVMTAAVTSTNNDGWAHIMVAVAPASGGTDYTESKTEAVGITDTATPVKSVAVTVTDAVGITETATPAFARITSNDFVDFSDSESVPITGTSRMLIAFAAFADSTGAAPETATMTYNSVAMTQVGYTDYFATPSGGSAFVYVMKEADLPANGTYTLTHNAGTAMDEYAIGWYAFENIGQHVLGWADDFSSLDVSGLSLAVDAMANISNVVAVGNAIAEIDGGTWSSPDVDSIANAPGTLSSISQFYNLTFDDSIDNPVVLSVSNGPGPAAGQVILVGALNPIQEVFDDIGITDTADDQLVVGINYQVTVGGGIRYYFGVA